jgi:hypothetical protein
MSVNSDDFVIISIKSTYRFSHRDVNKNNYSDIIFIVVLIIVIIIDDDNHEYEDYNHHSIDDYDNLIIK